MLTARRVEPEALGPRPTEVVLNVIVLRIPGETLQMKKTLPLNVSVFVALKLAVASVPCGTSSDLGVTATMKLGPGGTLIVKLAEWDSEPLVAVTSRIPQQPMLIGGEKTLIWSVKDPPAERYGLTRPTKMSELPLSQK